MKSQRKQSMVWGGLLVLFGIMSLLNTFFALNAWTWVTVLILTGIGILGIYSIDRSEKGLLIPSYVLFAVAGLLALITLNVLRDEAIATYGLTAIALPFLVAFLFDRTQPGLLIPAYVLVAVGVMVGLIGVGVLDDLLIPAYVLFAIAIPFFVVYFLDRSNWGVLIPGGITAAVGTAFLIAEAAVEYIFPAVLILAGAGMLIRQFTQRDADEFATDKDKLSAE